jgi:hypothetical protein
MPITPHTCITIRCDVCGYVYDQDEYTVHFTDVAEARKTVEQLGWLITTDRRVVCPVQDEEHQAAHDALMPPPPVTVPDGQTAIDLTGDPR